MTITRNASIARENACGACMFSKTSLNYLTEAMLSRKPLKRLNSRLLTVYCRATRATAPGPARPRHTHTNTQNLVRSANGSRHPAPSPPRAQRSPTSGYDRSCRGFEAFPSVWTLIRTFSKLQGSFQRRRAAGSAVVASQSLLVLGRNSSSRVKYVSCTLLANIRTCI